MMGNGAGTIGITGATCCRTICRRLRNSGLWPDLTQERQARCLCYGCSFALAPLDMTKEKILLGAHMSIGGGVHTAIERGCSIKCTAIQMFVKNNMQWFARPLAREEIRAFREHRQRGELLSIFAHSNYLINLAATNPQFLANSIRALSDDFTNADHLELPFLVLHPGAYLASGK